MTKIKIRIKIKAYDHQLVDDVAQKIVEVIRKCNVDFSGPIPLPTEKEIVTSISTTQHNELFQAFHCLTSQQVLISESRRSPKYLIPYLI